MKAPWFCCLDLSYPHKCVNMGRIHGFVLTPSRHVMRGTSQHPYPSPRRPPACPLSLWVCLSRTFRVNAIIPHVAFCIWLFHSAPYFPDSSNMYQHLIPFHSWTIFPCADIPQFVYLPFSYYEQWCYDHRWQSFAWTFVSDFFEWKRWVKVKRTKSMS